MRNKRLSTFVLTWKVEECESSMGRVWEKQSTQVGGRFKLIDGGGDNVLEGTEDVREGHYS